MTRTIKCSATQDDDGWVASIPKHGVYGYGRSLAALRDNLVEGLALIGVKAGVTLVPVSPELERLRSAAASYDAALTKAVITLTDQRITLNDIATAAGVPIGQVKAIRAKKASVASRRRQG